MNEETFKKESLIIMKNGESHYPDACIGDTRLKITHKGNYGINCTAPQSYIQLNADTLWQAWYNLFAFTWNKFWGFIK